MKKKAHGTGKPQSHEVERLPDLEVQKTLSSTAFRAPMPNLVSPRNGEFVE
jgi:hypothetical protein